jgi:hypothetical protein
VAILSSCDGNAADCKTVNQDARCYTRANDSSQRASEALAGPSFGDESLPTKHMMRCPISGALVPDW